MQFDSWINAPLLLYHLSYNYYQLNDDKSSCYFWIWWKVLHKDFFTSAVLNMATGFSSDSGNSDDDGSLGAELDDSGDGEDLYSYHNLFQ